MGLIMCNRHKKKTQSTEVLTEVLTGVDLIDYYFFKNQRNLIFHGK